MELKVEVVHNEAERRFEARVDGHLAVLEYTSRPGVILFTHTGVPEAIEGQGVGSQLAEAGLAYARAQGLRVVPLCAFVAEYIDGHPEYQSLVETR